MQEATGASNQGFLDLHNPTGLLAILFGFVIVLAFIIVGAIMAKAAARLEKAERDELRKTHLGREKE